jgi:hypothetical protein
MSGTKEGIQTAKIEHRVYGIAKTIRGILSRGSSFF